MNTHKNLQTRTDQELIHEFISGYQPCLEVLIARHKSKIYTSIYLLVKDSYLAEDIFQETFIKVIHTLQAGKYNEEGKNAGQARDTKGSNYGVSYNFGQITAGYTRKENENAGTSAATATDLTQDEFGIAFAATPNVTLAANYTKADSSAAATVDAKSKSVSVGYNLGPVAIIAQYAKQENITNTTATGDVDVAFIKINTNF